MLGCMKITLEHINDQIVELRKEMHEEFNGLREDLSQQIHSVLEVVDNRFNRFEINYNKRLTSLEKGRIKMNKEI